MKKLVVEDWVSLFREIGLTDEAMSKWHDLFEKKHPDSHQSFLEWLGLDEQKIKEIRKKHG